MVVLLSTKRSAMTLRMPESGIVSLSAAAGAGAAETGAAEGFSGAGAFAPPDTAAASTSLPTIRPPGPVPEIEEISTVYKCYRAFVRGKVISLK